MLVFLIILIPVSIILMMIGIRFWKGTIIGVLVWLLLEGAARKWLLPQYQAPILLVKDIALMAAYCGYLISPKIPVPEADKLNGMIILFLVVAVYCVLEALNPNLPNVALAAYGLKNYLMYIPLIFIIPQVFSTRESVQKLIFWTILTAIPICLLSLYQFTQPPTSWINKYVAHEEGAAAISLFGAQGEGEFRYGRARTASIFSYLSGFTTYLLLVVPLLAGRLLSSVRRSRETTLAIAALVLAIGGTITTGSRSPIVIFAAMAPMMVIILGLKGTLPRDVALRAGGALILFTLATVYLFSDALAALLFRAETAGDASGRFTAPLIEMSNALAVTPLFGMGIGSNSNASAMLADPSLYWLQGNLFEVEHARVIQDLGIAGFLLVYFLKFYATYLIIRHLIWSKSKFFVSLHVSILAFVVPHTVYLFTINNPTGGLLYWTAIGLSVAIFRIERAERRAMAAVRPAPRRREEPPGPVPVRGPRPGRDRGRGRGVVASS